MEIESKLGSIRYKFVTSELLQVSTDPLSPQAMRSVTTSRMGLEWRSFNYRTGIGSDLAVSVPLNQTIAGKRLNLLERPGRYRFLFCSECSP